MRTPLLLRGVFKIPLFRGVNSPFTLQKILIDFRGDIDIEKE